jgi:transposase
VHRLVVRMDSAFYGFPAVRAARSDAHTVALAAPRAPGLVQVQVEVEENLVVMGMLADRRDELGRARSQVTGRLHRLLLELLPGVAEVLIRPAGPR